MIEKLNCLEHESCVCRDFQPYIFYARSGTALRPVMDEMEIASVCSYRG